MKAARDGLKVVVCDDDKFIIDLIRKELEPAGYSIAGEASNGLDLIRVCEEVRPDIVIADIEMPTMNGIDATRELTGRNLAKCVIMLTSFDDYDYISGAIEAGASGYLAKPVKKDVLIPTIENCLKKSEQLYEAGKKLKNINKRIETRGIIDKAQLLLMEQHNLNEADAYAYIRNLSKDRGVAMAEIAEMVIAKYDGNMPEE